MVQERLANSYGRKKKILLLLKLHEFHDNFNLFQKITLEPRINL